MLVVGQVGWGPSLHQTRLTPDEQITHLTLWSMLAAPLLIGCDMTRLDPFTLELLTNDEVLEVDQDPLGQPGSRRARQGLLEVWSRPRWDGTIAVALFNRGNQPAQVTATWSNLGLKGPQPVRDLWQHQDLGQAEGSFRATVPPHGAVLVRIGKPQSAGK
jgi:alpha-galactosidase